MHSSKATLAQSSIPTYALYGEIGDASGADWVHCETIQARSRLHNYRIEPHRHETLFQILHLTGGRAEIAVDGRNLALTGPTLVTLPPMVVHGYTFSPNVEGTVLTLFDSRLGSILGVMEEARESFRSVQIVPLHEHGASAEAVAAGIAAIAAEIGGQAPGRLEAIEAHLTLVLIALHRLQGPARQASIGPGQRALQHALRYRELVDRDFRHQRSIDIYAGRLGLTSTHLNRICREHLGDTALGVIHQRIILEAKRYLTFTTMSAKEIALTLDFDDPAYFTRFFKHKTGLSPLSFRVRQNGTTV
jgi:AraC family transcriptional activator of pobA